MTAAGERHEAPGELRAATLPGDRPSVLELQAHCGRGAEQAHRRDHAVLEPPVDARPAVRAGLLEIPRPDGTVYVCGLSSEAPLPADPAAVVPDPGAQDRLRTMTATFAPALAQAEVVAAQACYRPVARDGLPLIGRAETALRCLVSAIQRYPGVDVFPGNGLATSR